MQTLARRPGALNLLYYVSVQLTQFHVSFARLPIDMFFVRFTLSAVGILLVIHVAWFNLMYREHMQVEAHYAAAEAVLLVDAVRHNIMVFPNGPLPSRVRLVSPSSLEVPPKSRFILEPSTAFIKDVRMRMRAGTDVRVGPPGATPTLWVRGPDDPRWIVVPVYLSDRPRLIERLALMLALVFSVTLALALVPGWLLKHSLRALAEAIDCFGRGDARWWPVPERGPFEMRLLSRGFNGMVSQLKSAEYDRTVMQAGLAHDLRAPLARLRLRAEILSDARIRDGVIHDVESMAHAVDAFLALMNDEVDRNVPPNKNDWRKDCDA